MINTMYTKNNNSDMNFIHEKNNYENNYRKKSINIFYMKISNKYNFVLPVE